MLQLCLNYGFLLTGITTSRGQDPVRLSNLRLWFVKYYGISCWESSFLFHFTSPVCQCLALEQGGGLIPHPLASLPPCCLVRVLHCDVMRHSGWANAALMLHVNPGIKKKTSATPLSMQMKKKGIAVWETMGTKMLLAQSRPWCKFASSGISSASVDQTVVWLS